MFKPVLPRVVSSYYYYLLNLVMSLLDSYSQWTAWNAVHEDCAYIPRIAIVHLTKQFLPNNGYRVNWMSNLESGAFSIGLNSF